MARIFTTYFPYKGETYTAVITISTNKADPIVTIYLPDESLHTILNGGRVTFSAENGLAVHSKELSPAQDLLTSVLTAVEAHENGIPKVNLQIQQH